MFGHKEGTSVMDNKRSTQDRIGADQSIMKSGLSKFLTLAMGLFVSGMAFSAVISINASQNPDNEIAVNGDLKASVEYTADGLKIEIPGVSIKVTCDGDEVSEESPCTIDLAQAGGSGGGDGSGSGGGDGDGSGGGDGDGSGGGDGDGSGGGDNPIDCSVPRDEQPLWVTDSAYEKYCNEDGSAKDPGSSGETPGYVNNPDLPPRDPSLDSDPCGVGFNPSCSASDEDDDPDPAPTRDLFNDTRALVDYSVERPEAADRIDYTIGKDDGESVNLGSAGEYGSYGRKRKVELPKGSVGVMEFTLATPTSLGDYCAAGQSAAAPYFKRDFDWRQRCNEDGTPKEYTDFCAAGRDAASSNEEIFAEQEDFDKTQLWDKVCDEDENIVKEGQEQQPEQRLDPNAFYLTFSESTTQAKGNFHLWLSAEKDGIPIEGCGMSGFPEGGWELSVGLADGDENLKDCNLEEGGSYYMMAAFCETSADDFNCKAEDAETALRNGVMSLNPNWYRTE